ncbi:MAG: hypothetical protein RI897_4597 [Verrucomicrobiota bacterium]
MACWRLRAAVLWPSPKPAVRMRTVCIETVLFQGSQPVSLLSGDDAVKSF